MAETLIPEQQEEAKKFLNKIKTFTIKDRVTSLFQTGVEVFNKTLTTLKENREDYNNADINVRKAVMLQNISSQLKDLEIWKDSTWDMLSNTDKVAVLDFVVSALFLLYHSYIKISIGFSNFIHQSLFFYIIFRKA